MGSLETRLGERGQHALFISCELFFELRHLLLHGSVLVPLSYSLEAIVYDTIELLLHAAVTRLEGDALLLVLSHDCAPELCRRLASGKYSAGGV